MPKTLVLITNNLNAMDVGSDGLKFTTFAKN